MKTIDELRRLELHLEKDHPPRASRKWGGADVVITRVVPKSTEEGFYPDPRYVVTKHALELSWLFESLRDAFYAESRLDSCSKIEFFGRLANAANGCLNKCPDLAARDLCKAVLQEAFSIYREMEGGIFESLTISVGNQIADD